MVKNKAFGPRIAGVEKSGIHHRVMRAAKMLHLNELVQRKPSQLSGGRPQRVAIGRALVREADVFLFDEPLSNLDAKLRSELRWELKHLHKELDHDLRDARPGRSDHPCHPRRGDEGGKIRQIESPATLYNRPTNMFVAGFLGAPSMNFFSGPIAHENGRPWFVGDVVRVDLSAYACTEPTKVGRNVARGVRPEHISPVTDGSTASGRPTISLIEPMGANQVVSLDARACRCRSTPTATSSSLSTPRSGSLCRPECCHCST
jgi:multiple sugar transport system ATP-binding protein